MKTFELSGVIIEQRDQFDKLLLIQPDGLKIDLLSRIIEITNSFGSTGQINYWISEKPITKDVAIESYLDNVYGGNIDADYETTSMFYSTLTGGSVDYESNLKIGGHDLYREIKQHEGKYLIIEIAVKEE